MKKVVLFVAILAAFSFGCGPKGPNVNHVEGIVTLDGEPVPGASVNFTPKTRSSDTEDLNVPLVASGRTDANGKYLLSAMRGGKIDGGTTVGEYGVSLSKKTITNLPKDPKVPFRGPPIYQYDVPKKFETPEDSGITVEVAKGKNVFNLALKSDGTFEVTK